MKAERSLTILSVAFPLLPVSSGAGGGAEQILYLLDKGFVESGHRSIVIAAKGSHISGDLLETPPAASEITAIARAEAQRINAQRIQGLLADTEIDLIHFHGLDFYTYLPAAKLPMLATLHLPVDLYPVSALKGAVRLNCVSQNQANSLPCGTAYAIVENGIDIDQYNLGSGKRGHLLWVGRICPEKGVHIALSVAHRLDLPAIIAGPIHPFREHQIYFTEKVRPLLDEKRRYIGPVDIQQKAHLLSGALCVLIPSVIAETSSLIAMEAIASGTPVIAFRSGALPEVVENGVTGFIVDSEEEMVRAVENADALSPQVCRSRALDRFDYKRMVARYLELYRELICGSTATQSE